MFEFRMLFYVMDKTIRRIHYRLPTCETNYVILKINKFKRMTQIFKSVNSVQTLSKVMFLF